LAADESKQNNNKHKVASEGITVRDGPHLGTPRQATSSKAVMLVQHYDQRTNCHPKIEQLKICQLKKHMLEVFAEFISSLLSLSDDCGEFWLSRIS
jgi:hypothetical protein